MSTIIPFIRKSKDLYKNMSKPVKASFWFLICNVLQAGIGVLSGMIFARLMTTDEYGVLNVFNSWKGIIIIFSSLNLSYGVFNNAMIKYEDPKIRDQYVSSMEALYGLITTGFVIFYAFFHDWCNAMLEMSTPVAVMMLIELYVCPALLFWSGRQRFEFKYRSLVFVTVIMSVLNVAIGIVLVIFSSHKAEARIFSQVLIDFFFCGYLFIYQLVKGKKLFVPKFWKFALAFNIPLIPHYLSEIVLNLSDRIMIEKLIDYSSSAKYSVAYGVTSLSQLLMSAINASFLPWAYAKIKSEKYSDIKKMANTMMIFIAVMMIFIMLLGPELILMFGGKKYIESIYVIPPLAASVIFLFLYDMFSTVEFYFGENIGVMIASVLSAALNVLLNYIFIPLFGYYAAGYTTLACFFIYSMAHYIFYRHTCKKHDVKEKVFDMKFLLAGVLVVLVMMALINIVYSSMIIRYILVVGILVLIFVKRNFVIAQFKEMKKPANKKSRLNL